LRAKGAAAAAAAAARADRGVAWGQRQQRRRRRRRRRVQRLLLNVMVREDLKDADFAHLTGVKKVNRAVAAAGLRVDPGRTWTDGRGGRR
jgi:hypothetical protein